MARTKRNNVFYVGLDLSISATGMVILDAEGNPHYSDVLKMKSDGLDRFERYRRIIQRIRAALPKDATLYFAIEDYAYHVGPGQTSNLTKLAELQGCVRYFLRYQLGFDKETIAAVAISSLKKFASGKGTGAKELVMLHVFQSFGFEARDNNEADAFTLAKICAGVFGHARYHKAYQNEVVEAVRNAHQAELAGLTAKAKKKRAKK